MAALLGAINAAACNGPGRRLATAHPGKGYHGIRVTAQAGHQDGASRRR